MLYMNSAFSMDYNNLPNCVDLALTVNDSEKRHVQDYLAGKVEKKEFWPSKSMLAAVIGDLDYIKSSKSRDALFDAFYVTLSSGSGLSNDIVDLFYDINQRSKNDVTPLMMAVNCNQIDIVKKIILMGGDVNDKTSDSRSDSLIMAIQTKNIDLVQLLLKSGANCTDSALSNGLTAIDIARKLGTAEIEKEINKCMNKSL